MKNERELAIWNEEKAARLDEIMKRLDEDGLHSVEKRNLALEGFSLLADEIFSTDWDKIHEEEDEYFHTHTRRGELRNV